MKSGAQGLLSNRASKFFHATTHCKALPTFKRTLGFIEGLRIMTHRMDTP
jgi:hypothetical protein